MKNEKMKSRAKKWDNRKCKPYFILTFVSTIQPIYCL